MSAYDMTFSDAIYGPLPTLRQPPGAFHSMLVRVSSLYERLDAKRGQNPLLRFRQHSCPPAVTRATTTLTACWLPGSSKPPILLYVSSPTSYSRFDKVYQEQEALGVSGREH